jgi:hypothetical protein
MSGVPHIFHHSHLIKKNDCFTICPLLERNEHNAIVIIVFHSASAINYNIIFLKILVEKIPGNYDILAQN